MTGLIVERAKPKNTSRSAATVPTAEAAIQTGLPDFNAPPVPDVKKASLSVPKATANALTAVTPMSSSGNWIPDTVYSYTRRVGTSQYFGTTVSWNTSTPTQIDSRFGMEVGIDLYNGATGTRGSVIPGQICGPNFRDQFIAKNYNWRSWTVFTPNGSLSGVVPYADLNDLLDSCGRNAMTIGFRDPQNFAHDSFGHYEVSTEIDAQIGVTSSSKLGGGIQLKSTAGVGPYLGPRRLRSTSMPMARALPDAMAP